MAQLFYLIGTCIIAIIMIVWANSRLKKGKDFRYPLIAGIIIYAISIIGAKAGGSSITGSIVAIILLGVAYAVLAGKVKR